MTLRFNATVKVVKQFLSRKNRIKVNPTTTLLSAPTTLLMTKPNGPPGRPGGNVTARVAMENKPESALAKVVQLAKALVVEIDGKATWLNIEASKNTFFLCTEFYSLEVCVHIELLENLFQESLHISDTYRLVLWL